jgi:hypothetical protein
MGIDRSFVAGAAVLALGLAGLAGGGAAPVHAAGNVASVLELTLEGKTMWEGEVPVSSAGTFRSRGSFCATGTFVDFVGGERFTCDDDSGSVTVSISNGPTGRAGSSFWRVLAGTGSYEGIRGRGSSYWENLGYEGDLASGFTRWRSMLRGVLERDAVAPTIDLASATATKLRQPARAYAIKLALALRDDVTANPVSYLVRVLPESCVRGVERCGGRIELARSFGVESVRGIVPLTLRIVPRTGLKSVRVQLTAEDPVGNKSSVERVLRLPR